MKIKNQLTKYLFIILTMVFAISCSGTTKSQHEHDEVDGHDMEVAEHNSSAEHEHNEGEDHEHNEGEAHDMMNLDHDGMMGDAFSWMPSEEFMSMMEYKTDNITMTTSGDEDVLMFSPGGKKASCMFKNMHGNVGVTATVKLESPDASVKLVHHSTDKDNYEFVALEGNKMKLGKVENGEEKILDTKDIEVPTDWFTLTATAAGEHLKGYLNDKMITHGHAEEMNPGMLGIIVSGNGAVSVKKVEATPLEAEH